MGQDQRRYPRADVALDATVETPTTQWKGKTLNLAPHGVKIESHAQPAPFSLGTSVRVSLHLADQNPPLRVAARVVRIDADGLALAFDRLALHEFQRLKRLVDSLLLHTLTPPLTLT